MTLVRRITAVAIVLASAVLPAQGTPPSHAAATAKPVTPPIAKQVANASAAKAAAKPSAITIEREVFAYGGTGRRDPFKSLLTTAAIRPALVELRLVAVAYDPNGQSVAILRDVNTKEQHRVRVGAPLGRMRVAAIRPKAVVFTIQELGYSRQETLGLNDSTAVRSK